MIFDYGYVTRKITYFENSFIIGKTVQNRNIYCIPIGKGNTFAVFAAAFHGLEYLTSPALLAFAEEFKKHTEYHEKIKLFIIPMVNPDGVEIAIHGIDPTNQYHQDIIKYTGIIDFTSKWQANAMGVDINHNFNADWESIYNKPSHSKYGGKYPESEPETRTIVKFLRKAKPELFIAFHSQGKEIYYDFNGMENKRSKTTAEKIADCCGYTAALPTGTASFGGAKDWFIKEFHKQAFTVELGTGKNPLPDTQLPFMKEDTIKICFTAIDEILKDKRDGRTRLL